MTSSIAFPGLYSSSPSSDSSSSTCQWSYDVFLSFRGEDTRNNFTAHLCSALCQRGINTYIDDNQLKRGEEISSALVKAIEESRISIVILSENYASSTWCLEELIKILECKESKQQMVLPVFYKVDPSIVRHQERNFDESLAKHEDRLKDEGKVKKWRTALKQVASISGWHLGINGDESNFIKKIVQEVSRIVNRIYLNVASYPVGIESRVNNINMLLSIGTKDTRMVGIYGIGGIGKTTIAKATYNLIADQFEGSCFLANVRETSKRELGLIQLQETILSKITGDSCLKLQNVDQGINVIKQRLCRKKILLVLDDVDHSNQLEKLCERCSWFGLGSRIIITTRDKHLLTQHNVYLTYNVKELDNDEALQLFSRYAFKNGRSNDGFVELTKLALHYAGGLPLALKVVGSNLYDNDIHYWKSELEKYKRIPEKNIQEVLKISYDGLDEYAQKIFLDIACFFRGEKREYVTKILENCGFFPDSGIKKLIDKCLITIDRYDQLMMHDLLEDMGREVVRKESPEEPGRRSRLWFHEDIRYVLEENTGTKQIEGILIDLPRGDRMIRLSPKVFTKMKKLRLFINRNARFCGGLNYLSNELRVIDWPHYPLHSLPSNFHGEKLVYFRMPRSLIKKIDEGLFFKNLTAVDFHGCELLTKISDLSSSSSLKELILDDCRNLVKVHDSVGFLDKLEKLSLGGCSNLESLPRSFKLRSLKQLNLEGCPSLQNFPEIECEMGHLKVVLLNETVIEELPSSIRYLSGLQELSLKGCKSLVHLPGSIFQLQHLEELWVNDCPNLVNFGKEEGNNRQLMPFPVSTTSAPMNNSSNNSSDIDCFSMAFPSLAHLNLLNCPLSESNLFRTFNYSNTLRELYLSESDIVSLPSCIKTFVQLRYLDLDNCKQLEEILQLPPNIEQVSAEGCMLLESFPQVSTKFQFNTYNLQELSWINLSSCPKMLINVGIPLPNPLLLEGHLPECNIIFPGNRIPDWFDYCKETSDGNSCEIEINGPLCLDEIAAIAFSAVIAPNLERNTYFIVSINDIAIGEIEWFCSTNSDHVCLGYSFEKSLEIPQNYLDGDILRFTFDSDPIVKAIFRSCGIHVIFKHEKNVKDHAVDRMDGIQLISKRRRDECEHNMDPDDDWNSQQRRHFRFVGGTLLDDDFNEDLDLEL
ncbi:disease resistance protein Roq1-like [Juglans microcarpa x Juglans regia]|uniref:disease resistance protein Roq1-like n=1 Tax=Juglans microcarpa x Juglans regia TaxID=2249226 RepID=UPI001B7DCB61|nr:disease resistance protein Roq1-like [Juglans microcarpa x Juglans regia]